jgi:hypothetical protein
MSRRFPHAAHVLRMAGLFVGGFTLFLIVRSLLVPADFGVHGFYRAGALDAVRARVPQHAGEAACVACHTEVADVRKGVRHENVRCESCHGPLARHADAPFDVRPATLDPRQLCLQCHARAPGKAATFPQVVPADHGLDLPCADCHRPHRPRIE